MRGQVIQVFEVEVVARLFIQIVQILYINTMYIYIYIYYSVDFVSGSVVRKKHQPIVV